CARSPPYYGSGYPNFDYW
nr:immunoglobulin heavy chain junction region [Macaca mulatta]MOV37838.1 immunoglobulin heavy chain junction region [Macaca mulatta]MOV38687.1 immunoglobulin heavy chain junction region [Macaca mulatta]MOV38887.1 immunoglobulin heavy chain junction region [Macaca mulatta]MOV38993.1 immunoglobulin heavy chain junction region [Macaca mulatta]